MSDQARLDFLNTKTHPLTEEEKRGNKEYPICDNQYGKHETLDAPLENAVRIEPCNHILGQECLRRHVTSGPSGDKCPFCRAVLFGVALPRTVIATGLQRDAQRAGRVGPRESERIIGIQRLEAMGLTMWRSHASEPLDEFLVSMEHTSAHQDPLDPEANGRRGAMDAGDGRVPRSSTFVPSLNVGTQFNVTHTNEDDWQQNDGRTGTEHEDHAPDIRTRPEH